MHVFLCCVVALCIQVDLLCAQLEQEATGDSSRPSTSDDIITMAMQLGSEGGDGGGLTGCCI